MDGYRDKKGWQTFGGFKIGHSKQSNGCYLYGHEKIAGDSAGLYRIRKRRYPGSDYTACFAAKSKISKGAGERPAPNGGKQAFNLPGNYYSRRGNQPLLIKE